MKKRTIKEYLKEYGIRITALSRQTGIPYSTLNDLVNGKTELERMQYGKVKAICGVLGLTVEQMEELCQTPIRIESEAEIITKNKSYYLSYVCEGTIKEEKLCKVNPTNRYFVKTMAETRLLRIENEERLNAWKRSTI